MTPLGAKIIRHIRQTGPVSLSDFMAHCLLDPDHGYYATRDPFGLAGDFITAPEISQMFGELIGLTLAQAWIDQGRPSPFVLAEPGPGRGTLMSDILRATRGVAGFHDSAQVVLIEASATLRQVQKATLSDHSPRWVDAISDLPDGPLFLVANEFFDALPIRQFQRDGDGWRERLIRESDGGGLEFGLGGPVFPGDLGARIADTHNGDIVETCPAGVAVASHIAQRIATQGGVALILDYGGWHSLGDTFQALQKHQPVDPFATPGDADLTAHVDFEPLALAAAQAGAKTGALTPQGLFLETLGITPRAQALASKLSGAALEAHIKAHRRLTHPDEMGNLFKVLAIVPSDSSLPAGITP